MTLKTTNESFRIKAVEPLRQTARGDNSYAGAGPGTLSTPRSGRSRASSTSSPLAGGALPSACHTSTCTGHQGERL
jgi:hypothetical protein